MTISRRNLLRGASGFAALSALSPLSAQTRHRVVVVGGGFAGSTLARYLSLWGGSRFDITLVDPRDAHVSCVMSNLVLTEALRLEQLTFPHESLAQRFGFTTLRASVEAIDRDAKTVSLGSGDTATLAYDSLVLAAGIEFEDVPGWDPETIPHAWIAGEQTLELKRQLDEDLPPGGTIVMTVPRSPYRCPPGPYERACLLAALARQVTDSAGGTGVHGTPRVIVLDANPRIQAEEATFSAAFAQLYGDIIDYLPNSAIASVNSDTRTVLTTDGRAFTADVLNVIPNHRAPALLRDAGLTEGTPAWAPVDPVTYESSLAEDIYVIGDSQATSQPKSGHMANAQAKVCADAIIRKATGLLAHTPERLANLTTNSACFSPVSFDEASWLTAVFRYNRASGRMDVVPESFGASDGWSRENYREMYTWASNLLSDTFV